MGNDFDDFIAWEATTRDTLDVKKIYIDMADDLLAGIALSEIVFWHLPDKHGRSKMRVNRDGHEWIAAPRWEWWERARITPRQSDRAVKVLRDKELIVTERWKWRNTPTVHIRINKDVFLKKWHDLSKASPLPNPFLPDGEMGLFNETVKSVILPNGEMDLTESLHLKTETTHTETTTENIKKIAPLAVPDENSIDEAPEIEPKPVQPHIALIDAYWEGLPGGKPPGEEYKRHVKLATALAKDGMTPARIKLVMDTVYDTDADEWHYKRWRNAVMPFEEIPKLIGPIEANQPTQTNPDGSDPQFDPKFATMTLQDQYEYNRRKIIENLEGVFNESGSATGAPENSRTR